MAKKTLDIRDKTIFDGIFVKYLLKFLYLSWFKITGWTSIVSAKDGAGITIAAPHTSNWDIVYALGAAIIGDVKIYFSIKDSWCRIPIIGRLILWLGAIPIDRSSSGQVVQIKQFVERHKNKRIFFLFTPEGTRGDVAKWKTGFYHVAQDCGLPIFLAKVDYRTKTSGVFHSFQLTHDKASDIESIQASYKRVYARYPEKQFPSYAGPLPEISELEARVMQAMYSLRGKATQTEIAAKAKFDELSTEMLEFLVEKGILEKVQRVEGGISVLTYKLTVTGNGCLLHLRPTLV